jgi:hypothetical protein
MRVFFNFENFGDPELMNCKLLIQFFIHSGTKAVSEKLISED